MWALLSTLALSISIQADTSASRNVLLNNEMVEVVHLNYPAGTHSGMHQHDAPFRTVYVVNGGEISIVGQDGTSKDLQLSHGQVFLMPAATHDIVNTGKTTVTLLEHELKTTASTQDNIEQQKEQITALLLDFLKNVDKAETHDRFWADDLVYTSSNGTRTNKAAILAGFDQTADQASEGHTHYEADNIDIRIYGTTAILAFTLVAHAQESNNSETTTTYYLNTGTLLKRHDRWQVIAWQATKRATP